MSDPESQTEAPPPVQPPRPAHSQLGPTSTARTQLEADELYARQLAEHYGGSGPYGGGSRSGSRGRHDQPLPKARRETNLKPNELYEDNHSFFDGKSCDRFSLSFELTTSIDDLPVIREQFKKGFQETQSKVNSFITNLKKKIDGDDEGNFQQPPPRVATNYNTQQQQQSYSGRRSGDLGRRSGDHERYDADPQVLGDDFSGLQLRDKTGEFFPR